MLPKVFEALQEEKLDLAESLLSKILRAEPKNPIALELMGVVCGMQKRPVDAIHFFKKCLQQGVVKGSIFFNIAKALHDQRKFGDAIEYHKKAIQIDPQECESWINYGLSLNNLNRPQEALECYERAQALNPKIPTIWINKAIVYEILQDYLKAQDSYKAAYHLLDAKKGLALWSLLLLEMKICDWSNFSGMVRDMKQALLESQKVATTFPTLLLVDSPTLALEAAKLFTDDAYPLVATNKPIDIEPHQKIRIGYFSADFREHPVAQLMAELFELHDRSRFEIFAFSLKDPVKDDPLRRRIKTALDHFYEFENKTDQEIAQLVRDLEIDIAIDLGGHTEHARTGIFANRVAPIQVNYLGYPGTMGASYIDYIIADPTLIPEAKQSFYTEKVAYLPDTYMPNNSTRHISTKQFTRSELGLPEQGFIFCCFNNYFKINPDIFDSWARILNQVPGSVLWFRDGNSLAKSNLIKEAIKRGVSQDRLIFARRIDEQSEYLASYALADLFLDTFPYNAHSTAAEALWAGLPVLTLIGQSFAARVAASLLNAIDLPELITHTQAEYESLAIELATHPEKLAQIKQKLQIHRLTKPLFDTPRYTKNIEAAYAQMYERSQAGLPPDHLYI
ncbi:tetratricopeptide repeat protein [Polynucleobacter paneuropaeus]|nr:tetratricopeptide repeat protein [Polynucleobacter paneuropaeus]QWD16329.1 tetratricopeptide repeat protein [Polynucleobacter paneuropaeus]